MDPGDQLSKSTEKKEGKDTKICGNYRPISLLNTNLNIFTNILAHRLAPVLSDMIQLDKVGFMQGSEARDATIRAIDIIYYIL